MPYCRLENVPLILPLLFPGKDFATEKKHKEIFCVSRFLTQTRHPAGAGRFQSPFPDES